MSAYQNARLTHLKRTVIAQDRELKLLRTELHAFKQQNLQLAHALEDMLNCHSKEDAKVTPAVDTAHKRERVTVGSLYEEPV